MGPQGGNFKLNYGGMAQEGETGRAGQTRKPHAREQARDGVGWRARVGGGGEGRGVWVGVGVRELADCKRHVVPVGTCAEGREGFFFR